VPDRPATIADRSGAVLGGGLVPDGGFTEIAGMMLMAPLAPTSRLAPTRSSRRWLIGPIDGR